METGTGSCGEQGSRKVSRAGAEEQEGARWSMSDEWQNRRLQMIAVLGLRGGGGVGAEVLRLRSSSIPILYRGHYRPLR